MSVWTLPLIAHDVWHASDQGGEDFEEELRRIPQALAVLDKDCQSAPFVQDCLADTFATYVMGPAYAFACISLLLDVHAPRDRVRAGIVFKTLRFLSGSEPNGPLSDDLVKEWSAACDMQWSKSGGEESCLLGQQCELVRELLSAYFANASSSTIACRHAPADAPCPMRDTALIEAMCSALMNFLYAAPLKEQPRYSDDAWVSKSKELEGFIRRSRGHPASRPELDGLFKNSGLDYRHVLRAGWYARWQYPDDESETTQAMAANIRDLCQALLESGANRGGGGGVSKDKNGSGI